MTASSTLFITEKSKLVSLFVDGSNSHYYIKAEILEKFISTTLIFLGPSSSRGQKRIGMFINFSRKPKIQLYSLASIFVDFSVLFLFWGIMETYLCNTKHKQFVV